MPIEITMPALSPTMTEGKLSKWLVKEGDKVSSGKVIAEIETDKATMEVEAVDDGSIGKIIVQEGTEGVAVNSVIALLLEEGEDKKALDGYKVESRVQSSESSEKSEINNQESEEKKEELPTNQQTTTTPAASPRLAPKPQNTQHSALSTSNRIKASPLARRLAEQSGINLASIVGSGPNGRIVKEDIENASLGGGAVMRNPVEFEHIPNSMMRKTVAKRLTESKQQVPHFYLSVDCEIDNLLDVRKQLNEKAAKDAGKENKPIHKLSVNDFVIKASALALKKVPDANASWYDDAIVRYNNVDISVAVAIEGGLITPIIQNADQKSLPQISNEMKELAKRARDGKLQPEEYTGGGFSISNLGMYGIKNFSAIINPPQSCILAIGAGEQRVVIKDGDFVAATVMSATLSVDHRAVDGALGAEFLAEFKNFIENPITMFV